MTRATGSRERIPHSGHYPELTFTAVLVGYGLGILITLSIGYASLILGFSIEGSELAAILGFDSLNNGLMLSSSTMDSTGSPQGLVMSCKDIFWLNIYTSWLVLRRNRMCFTRICILVII